jgi:hypothetical protein
VAEAGHDAPPIGEGGKCRPATLTPVQVLIQLTALLVTEVATQRGADELFEEIVAIAIEGHRANPSAASARRISPRARHRSVRTAA